MMVGMMIRLALRSSALIFCILGSVTSFSPQSKSKIHVGSLPSCRSGSIIVPRKTTTVLNAAVGFEEDGTNDSVDRNENNLHHHHHHHRRDFFKQALSLTVASSSASSLLLLPTQPAAARGLVQFPCTTPLYNTYHIMRGGTTLLEEEDIWSTNPLFLTNAEAALSEQGRAEVMAAVLKLKEANIQPSVIKYSLAASAMDSTAIVRDELKVGQNRVVPEFFFMDPRAIGKWDMMSYRQTLPAVIAMDEAEAGKDGEGGRPPPNDDGTPNETLADNSVRLRQLVSGIESQYSGDTVLLVFPDGTGPALLSAMIAGIPFNKVHELEFAPGELRLDVTMQSTLDLYDRKVQERKEEYEGVVKSGQKELSRLRSLKADDLVSRKDLLIEQERIEIDAQQRQRDEAREAKEEKEREARQQRAKDIEMQKEKEKAARIERAKGMDEARMRERGITPEGDQDGGSIPPLAIGGVFATFVGVALAGSNDDEDAAQKIVDNGNTTLIADVDAPSQSVPNSVSSITNTTSVTETSQDISPAADGTIDTMKEPSLDDVISEQSLYAQPIQTEAERARAANRAMQDYMDEDDGGDAWLRAMAEIVQEDDDNQDPDDNLYLEDEDSFQ